MPGAIDMLVLEPSATRFGALLTQQETSVVPLVGSDGAKTGAGDRLELMAPAEGEVGEAVAEDDGWAIAELVRGQDDRRPVALGVLPSSG